MFIRIQTVLFLLLFSNIATAQIGLKLDAFRSNFVIETPQIVNTETVYPSLLEIFSTSTPLSQTPKAYCYDDLAFFCKLEVELEKTSQFPVKFRLGDVDYVDYLEGKNNYLIK